MREEMEGNVFISHQSRHFRFNNLMMKVVFPTCTLTWHLNNYVSRQGRGKSRRNECTEKLSYLNLLTLLTSKPFFEQFKKLFQSSTLLTIFPLLKMATLGNKEKLAAINRDTREEHPRKYQARDTNVLRYQEDYITQVSEEIESRVTMKLYREFSWTKSSILGALSKLVEFPLNPPAQVHSVHLPETFRISNGENQETNGDRFQNDTYAEVVSL